MFSPLHQENTISRVSEVGSDLKTVDGVQFLMLIINTVLVLGRPPGGSRMKLKVELLKLGCEISDFW